MGEKELMVGDWVCYSKPNNYCTQVKEIKCTHDIPDDVVYYIKGQRDKRDPLRKNFEETFVIDILRPIPLTIEILEKNRFKSRKDGYEIGIPLLYWDKYCTAVCGWYNCNDIIEVFDCRYVHQLQHALRLCGIYKNIIL